MTLSSCIPFQALLLPNASVSHGGFGTKFLPEIKIKDYINKNLIKKSELAKVMS